MWVPVEQKPTTGEQKSTKAIANLHKSCCVLWTYEAVSNGFVTGTEHGLEVERAKREGRLDRHGLIRTLLPQRAHV